MVSSLEAGHSNADARSSPAQQAVETPVVAAPLDGVDMWPMLMGAADVSPPDYVTHARDGEAYDRYSWTLLALGSEEGELYNLAEVPTERANLAAQEPAIVADLSAALARFPRSPSIDLPGYKIVWDPDFFSGEADREPWADRVK